MRRCSGFKSVADTKRAVCDQTVTSEARDRLITNHEFCPASLDTWSPSHSHKHVCSFDCERICSALFTKITVTCENDWTHNHKRFDPIQSTRMKTIIHVSSLCLWSLECVSSKIVQAFIAVVVNCCVIPTWLWSNYEWSCVQRFETSHSVFCDHVQWTTEFLLQHNLADRRPGKRSLESASQWSCTLGPAQNARRKSRFGWSVKIGTECVTVPTLDTVCRVTTYFAAAPTTRLLIIRTLPQWIYLHIEVPFSKWVNRKEYQSKKSLG